MNLKNNKGFAGIDVSIAIIILLILVPVIGGITFSITKSGNDMEKKTYAMTIATRVLEEAKSINNLENIYSKNADVVEENPDNIYITNLINNIETTLEDNRYLPKIVTENSKDMIQFSMLDVKENLYKVVIDVDDFADYTTIENPQKNIVKKVTAKVTYSLGKKTDTIEISTIISKK